MNEEVVCQCGHPVYLHSDGLPGCIARLSDGSQCECGKTPKLLYEDAIDALRRKLDNYENGWLNTSEALTRAIEQRDELQRKLDELHKTYETDITSLQHYIVTLNDKLEVAKEVLGRIYKETHDPAIENIASEGLTELK